MIFGERKAGRRLVREVEEYLQVELAKRDNEVISASLLLTLDVYDAESIIDRLADVRQRLNVPPSVIQLALESLENDLECRTALNFSELQ